MISVLARTPRPIAPLSSEPLDWGDGIVESPLQTVRELHADGLPGLELREFVSVAWGELEPNTPLQWNWHLDALCDHVEALLLNRPGPNGEPCPQNLLINVPPGCMKSLIFSVFAPAWMWLFRPGWRAIYASGNPAVVTRDSLKTRQLITSDWYQKTFAPAWKISEDQNEKQHFANTLGGFRRGVGAGGTVTGDRADFLGVDDANDAKEIHQKAHRDQINEKWWDMAFHNRIADPTLSKRGMIMQRLHEEDATGYVIMKEGLASRGGEWAHLVIPMEADADGPGDRRTWIGWTDPRKLEGELMFPERFTPEYLEGEKKTLGSSGYAGQMQQRPVAAEGNRFKREWWRFWSRSGDFQARPKGANAIAPLKWDPVEELKKLYQVIASWDMTFKDTDGTDYVVGIAVAIDGARRIVLELSRDRRSFPDTVREVKAMQGARETETEPAVEGRWPMISETLVEDKANGPAVIKSLEAQVSGLIAVQPEGGKESRAAIMQPKVEAGNWYLPEGAPWLDVWFDEFGAFPKGKHDDIVDAGSQIEVRLINDDTSGLRALLGQGGGS